MSVTRVPSVLITRQPPEKVPAAIAAAQVTLTQSGIASSAPRRSPATSVSVITPIVFCASLVPWASATSELEAICPSRKPRLECSSGTDFVSPNESRVAR